MGWAFGSSVSVGCSIASCGTWLVEEICTISAASGWEFSVGAESSSLSNRVLVEKEIIPILDKIRRDVGGKVVQALMVPSTALRLFHVGLVRLGEVVRPSSAKASSVAATLVVPAGWLSYTTQFGS